MKLYELTAEINRTAVKEALKSGIKLPGALLGRTQSLIIK